MMEERNVWQSMPVYQPIPVHEAASEYLDSQGHLSPRTLEEYTTELWRFVIWCAPRKVMLHEVNSKSVYRFIEDLKTRYQSNRLLATRYASSTLLGYVKVIKTFYGWCLNHVSLCHHVNEATLRQLKLPVLEEKIIQPYSKEDINGMFLACENEQSVTLRTRDKAILAVLYDTGIRASELVTLTLSNTFLDLKDPHLRIFGKGSKWGEVSLGEQARVYTQTYIDTFRMPVLKQRLNENPRLKTAEKRKLKIELLHSMTTFVSREEDKLSVNGLHRIMTRLGEWARVMDVRCNTHTWRHTFAVNFMRDGGDIYTLSKILRHSSLDVTEDYLKSLKQTEVRKWGHSVLDNLNLDL